MHARSAKSDYTRYLQISRFISTATCTFRLSIYVFPKILAYKTSCWVSTRGVLKPLYFRCSVWLTMKKEEGMSMNINIWEVAQYTCMFKGNPPYKQQPERLIMITAHESGYRFLIIWLRVEIICLRTYAQDIESF